MGMSSKDSWNFALPAPGFSAGGKTGLVCGDECVVQPDEVGVHLGEPGALEAERSDATTPQAVGIVLALVVLAVTGLAWYRG